jgi:phenylalanine-4-hydroxylase
MSILSDKYKPSQFPATNYTEADVQTWRTLLKRYTDMIPLHMCEEYLDGFAKMQFPMDRIPSLTEVEGRLRQFSDWRVARVFGLVPDEDFYGLFAEKIFPSNDFIRKPEDIDYTPSPDIFHEVIGHIPMLTNKFMADFTQKLGQFTVDAVKKHGLKVLTPISRIYWFTLEFGLIETPQGTKIFGAGFAPGEMQHALTDAVEKRPFNIDEIAMFSYKNYEMQDTLFVAKSFEDMTVQFDNWSKRFDPNADWGINHTQKPAEAA